MSNTISMTLSSWSRTLRQRWDRRPLKEQPLPHNLSLAQGELLSQLKDSPAWPPFLSALQTSSSQIASVVLRGQCSPEEYHFLTGQLVAMDRIAQLPDTLSLAIRERKAQDERRATGPDRTTERIGYGHPNFRDFWKHWRPLPDQNPGE